MDDQKVKDDVIFTSETKSKVNLVDCEKIVKRLEKPKGRVDVVIDTDTYNEVDDQYALAYLVKSSEKCNLKAIYAAPFYNCKSKNPADGMEKSYMEIMNILTLLRREELKEYVFRGSTDFLSSETQPIISDAACDLVSRSLSYSEEKPLYVIAIGAITNIASAILLDPDIIKRIVLIWLGGSSYHWEDNREFNLSQDVAAARIVFGCGVPLVQLPCMGVVSSFATTGPEIEHHLRGKNALCDYLVDITIAEAANSSNNIAWSRTIWDVTAVAWLLDGDYVCDKLVHSPIPEYDGKYSFDESRHFIKYAYHINRDNLFDDLFYKLSR